MMCWEGTSNIGMTTSIYTESLTVESDPEKWLSLLDKCTKLPNSWARYPKETIFSFLIFKFFKCSVGPQRFALGPSVPKYTVKIFVLFFGPDWLQQLTNNGTRCVPRIWIVLDMTNNIFWDNSLFIWNIFLLYTFGIFFLSSKPEKKTIFFTHCTKLEPNLLFLFWIMHQTNKLGALSKRDTLYFRCGGWWHIHPGQILASPFQNGPQFQLIGRSLGIYGWFCFKSLNTYHVCHIFDNSCCLLCFFHLYHYCH